tara:strand:+ start:377 stop:532 length:156 start_codon:yes stop_codon:yes gene_type:complete
MFYELPKYYILHDKMNEWVHLMDKEVIPFMIKNDIDISASFRGTTDDTACI